MWGFAYLEDSASQITEEVWISEDVLYQTEMGDTSFPVRYNLSILEFRGIDIDINTLLKL